MLATLRKLRIAAGILSALLFVTFVADNIVALVINGSGFLGNADMPVFLFAFALLVACIVSIPFLKSTEREIN